MSTSSFTPLPGLSVVILSTIYLEISESVSFHSLLYVTKTFSHYIIYHTFILTAYLMSNDKHIHTNVLYRCCANQNFNKHSHAKCPFLKLKMVI